MYDIATQYRVHIQICQFIPHTYPPSSLQSLFHGMHILRVQQSFYEIKQSSRVRSAYTMWK